MSTEPIDNTGRSASNGPQANLAPRLLAAVAGIRFGSVELVIHDGQVVQIERRERMRLQMKAGEETGD